MSIVKNIPLLQKALDHIEAHPEEWNQGSWGQTIQGCGTAACLAGHIALLDGWIPVLGQRDKDQPQVAWEGVTKKGLKLPYVAYWEHDEEKPQTQYTMVSDAAQTALGIDDEEWCEFVSETDDYLWGGMNDREDLWRIANSLAGGQLILPMDLQ